MEHIDFTKERAGERGKEREILTSSASKFFTQNRNSNYQSEKLF
jgi:hypothetical protein